MSAREQIDDGNDDGAAGPAAQQGGEPGWRIRAREMHAVDPQCSISGIARELGVSVSSAWRALHPERAREMARRDNARRNTAKRAHENGLRATCGRCGGEMGAGTRRVDGSRRNVGEVCAVCRTDHRVTLVLEMWRIRRNEGLLNTQIAARLGVSVNTVTIELHRLRALGYHVPVSPYRRGGSPRSDRPVLDKSALSLRNELQRRGIHPDAEPASPSPLPEALAEGPETSTS